MGPHRSRGVSLGIIASMKQATGFDHWRCRDKARIIEADALSPDFAATVAECTGSRPIDWLYADIRPNLPAAQTPRQTAQMACALRAKAAGWWGQETPYGFDADREFAGRAIKFRGRSDGWKIHLTVHTSQRWPRRSITRHATKHTTPHIDVEAE